MIIITQTQVVVVEIVRSEIDWILSIFKGRTNRIYDGLVVGFEINDSKVFDLSGWSYY